MVRRIGAALIGAALALPILVVAPVAAHPGAGNFSVDFSVQADGDVVGFITNHALNRRSNVTVTVTWENGSADIVESDPLFVSNLAPHSSSPFRVDPAADVTGLTINVVDAFGAITETRPTGGLEVSPCTIAADVCTGTVTNEGSEIASDIEVYAVRHNGSAITDAAESANIPTIAAGASAPYAITFQAGTTGTAQNLIAQSNSGVFFTSWNNYFGDLGNTSVGFVDDIAFVAHEGITTGCGDAIFCPRDPVSRAQMAVFLDRALGLADAPDQGFTDIAGQSAGFRQAINNIAAAGISAGCQVAPKQFCPHSPVTRGQMSKFIVLGYELTVIHADAFTDDDGHFSEAYNDTMAANGITTGCASGTARFCPNLHVLREQMAVFLARAEAL